VICETLLITATRSASLKFNVTFSAGAWKLANISPHAIIVVVSLFINYGL
jgi:hypothetical protein